jgi:hypothetical protein
MVNYQQGKIYEIICNITGQRYIGSTTQKLSKRLVHHRSVYNTTLSKIIIQNGNYYINLLEEYACENKEQLLKKEREWFDKLECINKFKPYISEEELKTYRKENCKNYYQKNSEKVVEYQKKYREKNKEKIKEQKREYYMNKK